MVTLSSGPRIDTLHHSAGSPDRDRVHCHAEITGQIGGLLWIKWLWDGRLIVAVGQEHEDFSLWGCGQKSIKAPGDRITDVCAVVTRSCRPHGTDGFLQKAVIENRWTG